MGPENKRVQGTTLQTGGRADGAYMVSYTVFKVPFSLDASLSMPLSLSLSVCPET